MVYIPVSGHAPECIRRIVKRGNLERLADYSKTGFIIIIIKINLMALSSPVDIENGYIAIANRINPVPSLADADTMRGGEAVSVAGNRVATGGWLFKGADEKIGFHDFLLLF